ncbi:MAG: helix-turn-helix domain-containing protein [Thermomicrobiales bacterium]
MSDSPLSTLSSGNPFADLGMPDADTRLATAKLALRITSFMHDRQLTQSALAQLLDIDQPKVSAITRGQLKDFSLERLMSFVNRLDLDIEIRVSPNPEPSRRARMVVRDSDEPLAASTGTRSPASNVRFN